MNSINSMNSPKNNHCSIVNDWKEKPVSEIRLMKGNEALAEAAIRAGCQAYFGYPITPQSEILEYLADQGRKRGMIVLQAESEVASINMVYGAAGAGAQPPLAPVLDALVLNG